MRASQQIPVPGGLCCETTRDQQMQTLIGLFAALAKQTTGITYTCESLLALAAPFNCIPPDQRLLVLIVLAAQMQPGVTPPTPPQVFQVLGNSFGGYPNLPTNNPGVGVAVNIDPTDGFVAWFYNGTWH